jgi:hypothetical protein
VQHLFQWKNHKYYILWERVCSLSYPARSTHEPYCHLWPAQFYNIFLHYLINGAIIEKKFLNIKCVLIFFSTFVWNISNSKKNRGRYDKKCMLVFMWITRYSCQTLMKLEFSSRIIEKNTQMSDLLKIFLVEAELFHADGRTDRRAWRN